MSKESKNNIVLLLDIYNFIAVFLGYYYRFCGITGSYGQNGILNRWIDLGGVCVGHDHVQALWHHLKAERRARNEIAV